MKEQHDELSCGKRDGTNSLQIEGGAHSKGGSFRELFSREALILGGSTLFRENRAYVKYNGSGRQ